MGNTETKPITGGVNDAPVLELDQDDEYVEITNKFLTVFPAGLSQLPKLRSINLTRNRLNNVTGVSGVLRLEDLDLSNNSLVSIQDDLCKCLNLTNLNISFNQINVLSPLISHLKNLKIFNLSNNQIPQVPPEIGFCNHLTIINLSFNRLKELPSNIGKLNGLSKLILNNNQIQTLPGDIGGLVQLTLLDLAENELRTLPTQINRLRSLVKLYLDNNDFLEMIPEVGDLTQLKELNLRSNQLVDLPNNMHRLVNLTILDLDDNQWESAEYINVQDIKKLLAHLKVKKDVVNKSRKSTSKEFRRTIQRQKLEDNKKRLSLEGVFNQPFQIVQAKKQLYQIKANMFDAYVVVNRMEPVSSSLNANDVFLMNTGKKLYMIVGQNANQRERLKGLHLVKQFSQDAAISEILTIDFVKSKKEDIESFWRDFGGKPINLKPTPETDLTESVYENIIMYKFAETDGRLDIQVFSERISKSHLDSQSCLVLDTGCDIYLWIGLYCSQNEKNWALLKAEQIHSARPSFSELHWVMEDQEPFLFKEYFYDWVDTSWDPNYKTVQEQIEREAREAEADRLRMEKEEAEEAARMNRKSYDSANSTPVTITPPVTVSSTPVSTTPINTSSTVILPSIKPIQTSNTPLSTQSSSTSTPVILPSLPSQLPNLSNLPTYNPPLNSTATTSPQLSERDKIKEREKEKIREKLKQRENSNVKLPSITSPTSQSATSSPSATVLPSIPKSNPISTSPKLEKASTSALPPISSNVSSATSTPSISSTISTPKAVAQVPLKELPTIPQPSVTAVPTKTPSPTLPATPSKALPTTPAVSQPTPVATAQPVISQPTATAKPVVQQPTVTAQTTVTKPAISQPTSIATAQPVISQPTTTAQPVTQPTTQTAATTASILDVPQTDSYLLTPLPEKSESAKRKPATKNPIKARQERAAIEEEAAKKRKEEEEKEKLSSNSATAASTSSNKSNTAAALGGFGLLYSVGANEQLFKRRQEQQQQAQTADPFAINVQPKDQPKLLHIKGRRSPFVRQVELSIQSLNKGDVFILDCGKEKNLLYQWNGSESNRIEKGKGMDIAKSIKDKERVGCRVIIVDEGKEPDDFWKILGWNPSHGEKVIASADSAGDDREAELNIRNYVTLYRAVPINGDKELDLVALQGRLSKTLLEPEDCYILDCISEMFVWTGSNSKLKVRNMSLKLASEMFSQRTCWTSGNCHREFPGSEQVLFKERFPDWGGSLPIMVQQTPSGVNTASTKKQEKIDISSMHKPRLEKEEVMIDDGTGKLKIWRIEEFQKVELNPSQFGQFYSGDSYLVLYTYFFKNKDNYLIYFWQGRNSSINEKGTSALLTVELDDSLKGMAKEVRVTQNKEPKHFLTIFKGKFIVHSGKDPLSKNYKPPASPKDPKIYHIRGTHDFNTRAIESKLSIHTLNSYHSFVVNNIPANNTIYIWSGKHSNQLEKTFAKNISSYVSQSSGAKIIEIQESKEPSDFLTLFPSPLTSPTTWPFKSSTNRIEPRLYLCTVGSGVFSVEEVNNFAQDDLIQEDVFIVDGIDQVWVWIGTDTAEIERRMSMEVAIEYSSTLSNQQNRKNNIPVYVTYHNKEPFIFTSLFQGWDFSKRSVANIPQTYDKDIILAQDILDLYTKKYTYDELINKKYPKGIDGSKLEEYLSDDEFFKIFKMTLPEFQKLSLWKKQAWKKELRLY